MDLKSLDYHCPRCHATIGFDRDSCPACQSVLLATVPPWPTIQAHDGGVGSPPNASALGNAANSQSPAYIPTYPTPDALNRNHQLDLTTQPPPTLIGSNGIRAGRERLYRFIHHSGPPAVDTVRNTRACLSCYNSVKCRPGPNPECCGPCKGKNRYCRGPIHAPVLIDIQSWFKIALAGLQSRCSSLETIVKERSMYSLSIKFNKTGAIESYDVDLRSIDDHAATPYDPSSLVRVLDVVFPADQKACLNIANPASRPTPDDNVESVVRRFVACSMLLCAPASSRIDRSQYEHAAAPYVILEFIRHIGHEACNLFQCIFHEADEFANSKPRNKVTFVGDKRSFAFNLGLVYSSVHSLISAKSNWTGSHFMPETLYDVVPAVLEKLEWLAMGFNKTAFVDGRRCLRSELTELHIGLSSLEGRRSISDSRYRTLRLDSFGGCMLILQQSSNQACSPGDNLVPNVPRINSPIAQDSAAQSPSQVSDSSLFQRSGENMVENFPESPWLAGEIERISQNDLYNLLMSPVEERSLQEDIIRRARTELKDHDSAINKHLVKKAVLQEKSKPWQLDPAVSSNIFDSDGCAVNSFRSARAVRKRIRELEEASKRQDLAIQKHNTKKAALERGIKRNLDYEPGQPSKKPVFEAAERDTLVSVPGENQSKKKSLQNSVKSYAELLGDGRPGDSPDFVAERPGEITAFISDPTGSLLQSLSQPYDSRLTASTEVPLPPPREVAPCMLLNEYSSIPAKASRHHGRRVTATRDCYDPTLGSLSQENYRIESPGDQATSEDTVQEPPRQIPFKEIIEQREYASEGPATSGRSFTHWLLRRRPSSFGSVMNGMFKKFERLAIGAGSARKRRDKRAVAVGDSVKT